jgi:UDP-N-acetylmuramyl pentapeptide phosphotransferase/UDP-N-acetylglucosamine-1-phosphate transferase
LLRLFILSFAVSAVIGYLILRWWHLHARFTADVASRGSHKLHVTTVSRIGGVSVFGGWLVGLVASIYYRNVPFQTALVWIVCMSPVFFAGLAEDVTKRVSPRIRLLFSFATAALAFLFLDAAVRRLDLFGIDPLLAIPVVSFLFTVFAVGGVAHAVNIIDGLNGLALSVCLMAFLSLGYVAFNVHDNEILLMSGLGIGALLGLHVWNFPSGRIYCGDGGAYFLGAYVAILSTLLVARNPQVSAWFPLLLVLYPVWETLFSAYRRRVLRGVPASAPDRLHLHSLIYKRVKHGVFADFPSRRNSDASVFMVMLVVGNAIPAVLWWQDTSFLIVSAVVFAGLYLTIYRRLVRFGTRRGKMRAATIKG